MILTTLLTSALAASLAATAATAAAIENRNTSPSGNDYTVLGCIDYNDPKQSCWFADDGSTQMTLDQCLHRGHGQTYYLVTWTGRGPNDKGCCKKYRNTYGPTYKAFSGFPTTKDGYCATKKGVTAFQLYSDATYVGCYDKMWWYKSQYRPGWGKFKPRGNRTPEVAHTVTNFSSELTKYENPLFGCIRNCDNAPEGQPGVAMNSKGECICTSGDVRKTAPTKCTADTWVFVWAAPWSQP